MVYVVQVWCVWPDGSEETQNIAVCSSLDECDVAIKEWKDAEKDLIPDMDDYGFTLEKWEIDGFRIDIEEIL